MSWFRNLRLTPKLVGSFVFFALLTGVVGAVGYSGLNRLDTDVSVLTAASVPSFTALLATQRDLNGAMRYTRGASMTKDLGLATRYADSAKAARQQAHQDWQTYMGLPFSGAHEQSLAQSLVPVIEQWMTSDAQVELLTRKHSATGNAAAAKISLGEESAAATTLTAGIGQLVAINEDDVHGTAASAANTLAGARNTLIAVALLAVLLALALGWFIAQSIAEPVRRLSTAADHLSVGDTEVATMLPPASHDEIGLLSASFHAMVSY
jgi:methyl-accepting chemotaxis protein